MNRHVIIPSILSDIFPNYFEFIQMNVVEFSKGVESGDYKSIMRLAHDIAGTAQSYGLKEVGDISKKIENAIYENNFNQAQELITQYSNVVNNITYSFSADRDMTL